MKRIALFALACLVSLPSLAQVSSSSHLNLTPTATLCNAAFEQSSAWQTCRADPSMTMAGQQTCRFRAVCQNGEQRRQWTTINVGYPHDVYGLVNCNGSLRKEKC